MLLTLIKKEILNNLLNLRFTLSYSLCIILLVGSIGIMIADYIAEKHNYDINNAIYSRQADEIPGSSAWFLGEARYYARTPVPTKILASGSEKDPDLKGRYRLGFSPYFFGDFRRNPLVNLFPTVDMVFIVGLILSLLVFVLAYDSIAGEREAGTLLVLLAAPIPRDFIVTAKWFGGLVSLLVPFIISWLIIALIIIFFPALAFTAKEWSRFVLIAVACVVYITVVFSISMAVSIIIRHSGTVVLALLLIWVVFFVEIPALSTPIAYLIVKPQSVEHIQETINRTQYVLSLEYRDKFDQETIRRYGKKFGSILPEEREIMIQFYRDLTQNNLLDVVDKTIQEGRKRAGMEQNIDNLGRAISRFSPYGCFQNMCVTLAGTDMQRVIDLNTSVENYYRIVTKIWDDYSKSGKKIDEFPAMSIPRYRYEQSSVLTAVEHCIPDLGVLVLMGILAVLIGYIRFLRVDII